MIKRRVQNCDVRVVLHSCDVLREKNSSITYIAVPMHVSTIATVVVIVMVINIWEIISKMSWRKHSKRHHRAFTWLSFRPVWITPILTAAPLELLHFITNEVRCQSQKVRHWKSGKNWQQANDQDTAQWNRSKLRLWLMSGNHYENLSILIIFQSKMEMPSSLSDESVNFCLLVPTNIENICKRITFFNKIPSYEINQR